MFDRNQISIIAKTVRQDLRYRGLMPLPVTLLRAMKDNPPIVLKFNINTFISAIAALLEIHTKADAAKLAIFSRFRLAFGKSGNISRGERHIK